MTTGLAEHRRRLTYISKSLFNDIKEDKQIIQVQHLTVLGTLWWMHISVMLEKQSWCSIKSLTGLDHHVHAMVHSRIDKQVINKEISEDKEEIKEEILTFYQVL